MVAALNKWQSINLGKELIDSKHCSLTDTGKIVALILRKSQDRNTGLFLPFSVSPINILPIIGASYFFSSYFCAS